MKRLLLTLVLMAAMVVPVWAADCPGGMCPPERSANAETTPNGVPECVCRVIEYEGAMSVGLGSGVLICKTADGGAVWTVAHMCSTKEIEVFFPTTRERIKATVCAIDKRADIALLWLAQRPRATIARLANAFPAVGSRVWYGGFGQNGDWKVFRGRLLQRTGQTRANLPEGYITGIFKWEGGSRQGDSGGPVWLESGRTLGVISVTNGAQSYGPGVDRLQELAKTCQYLAPWNADLAEEKARIEAGAYNKPPVAGGGGCDPSMAASLGRIEAALARLEGREISVPAPVPIDEDALAEKVGAVTEGGVKATVTSVVKGMLTKFGIGGGLIGAGLVSVAVFFILRVLKSNAMSIAVGFDKLTDVIPTKIDDRADAYMYSLAEKWGGGKRPPDWNQEFSGPPQPAPPQPPPVVVNVPPPAPVSPPPDLPPV